MSQSQAPGSIAGQTRIGRRFAQLRAAGRKALMPYVTAGDPDPETSYAIVRAVCAAGADLLELGVPFSDPMADGPQIQAGTQRALAAGMTPAGALEMVRRLRADGVETPIALMTYYNLIYRPGPGDFCSRAAAAGADGLIVPDLPLEEADELRAACAATGLDLIPLLAPTAPPERVAAICRQATGFVYCVSLTGVTGVRNVLSDRFVPLVARARELTRLPLAVGFGISTPEQAARVAAVADGAIVGSALVAICGEPLPPAELVDRAAAFVGSLKQAMG